MKISALAMAMAAGAASVAVADVDIAITDAKTAAFALQVDGATWLTSADTRFFVDGKWHAASDGSLVLKNTAAGQGQDVHGPYNETVFTWFADTTPITTRIKVYTGFEDFVVFEQAFPAGANGTDMGDREKVNSAFPAFNVEDSPDASNPRGYLAYSGCMIGDGHVGGWNDKTDGFSGGLDGGPLAVFDSHGNTTVVISSYSQFMASSFLHELDKDSSSNTVSYGTIGTMDPIPAGYSTGFIAYVGSNGVNDAFEGWGATLLRTYGKSRDVFESDYVLNYLGYSTDNGAYYYYHTEGAKGRWTNASNMEPTLHGVKAYADEEAIPYKYILLDSWWYPKNEAEHSGGGVMTWTALPAVFPNGLAALWESTGWPVMGHNRFWSHDTPYAKQNGGDYEFEIGANDTMAMPLEQRFWDDLLRNSSEWGLITYEQDWLYNEFEGVTRATTDVNLARNWLLQMGRGAANNHMTIQYCMPYPRHVLQSVEIQQVTNFRASGDYGQDRNDQWHVGQSSIVAHALSLGPSKDNYWSVAEQPDNDWGDSQESRSALQSVVSSYSTGPVAPSDRIKYSDSALINRACDSAGRLLKPTKPATAIDATFLFRADLTTDGPDGELWSGYTEFRGSGLHFDHILAADLKSDFALKPSDLSARRGGSGPAPPHGNTKAVAYSHPTSSFDAKDVVVQAVFDETHPLTVPKCGEKDFRLFHTAPVLAFGDGWAVLGEMAKWVPVSTDRIVDISVDAGATLQVDVKGGAGENVTMAFYNVKAAEVHSVGCTLSELGTASFVMPAGTCQ